MLHELQLVIFWAKFICIDVLKRPFLGLVVAPCKLNLSDGSRVMQPLLRILEFCSQGGMSEYVEPNLRCATPIQALQRAQKSTKQDLQLARKQLHLAKAQLAELRQTSHPHPAAAPGFDPDVNRNLMTPVPSKPVEVASTSQSRPDV